MRWSRHIPLISEWVCAETGSYQHKSWSLNQKMPYPAFWIVPLTWDYVNGRGFCLGRLLRGMNTAGFPKSMICMYYCFDPPDPMVRKRRCGGGRNRIPRSRYKSKGLDRPTHEGPDFPHSIFRAASTRRVRAHLDVEQTRL